MIDRVATTARGAPLEATELIDEAVVVEQLDSATVHERQQISVQIALGLRRLLVANAEF